ncbi:MULTISPECIES: adenosine deaminase [unclassified Novosphingobium]|uniref:adenosine deaminase family protein n=1 Tax=unclassified Novosphingobium TaxID=2644732 RepID=UPI00190F6388|nr:MULTISPECIES: adenosine deaminase [unclassified Novosphingobium]
MKRVFLALMSTCSALPLAAPVAHADAASEAAASALVDSVSGNAGRLRVVLQAMPKGGDLHNHLGGSVYAEDFLKVAAEKGMCADDGLTRIVPQPCAPERNIASMAVRDPFTYAKLVDAISTRGFQKGIGPALISGHSQFFSSFGKFGPAFGGDVPRWLADAYASAGRNNLVYLELMYNPGVLSAYMAAGGDEPIDESMLGASYKREIATVEGLLAETVSDVTRNDAEARKRLGCGTAAAKPGCDVAVRYLYSAMRGVAPAQAWRSLIAGFALAHRDARFVGVNIVMPEDDPVALRDYDLHMAMFRFLEAKYPDVKVTMHAGELALGLVPPLDLQDHIAKAIDAGAKRIGHGVDIAYEAQAPETLARMAREGIAVEINLTSNAVILGVEGGNHPLQLYRSMGVPVMLSTDDEGVLRSDMSNEYVRAVTQQGLHYGDLKEMARASLEYSFSPGASLWRARRYGDVVQPCADGFAEARCKTFLAGSEKARLQARLETNFEKFEHSLERFGRQWGVNEE